MNYFSLGIYLWFDNNRVIYCVCDCMHYMGFMKIHVIDFNLTRLVPPFSFSLFFSSILLAFVYYIVRLNAQAFVSKLIAAQSCVPTVSSCFPIFWYLNAGCFPHTFSLSLSDSRTLTVIAFTHTRTHGRWKRVKIIIIIGKERHQLLRESHWYTNQVALSQSPLCVVSQAQVFRVEFFVHHFSSFFQRQPYKR